MPTKPRAELQALETGIKCRSCDQPSISGNYGFCLVHREYRPKNVTVAKDKKNVTVAKDKVERVATDLAPGNGHISTQPPVTAQLVPLSTYQANGANGTGAALQLIQSSAGTFNT